MMYPSDPLQEVYKNDYGKLMKLLEKEFPLSLTFYGWLKTRLAWEEENPGIQPFYICSPDGDITNGVVFYGNIDGRTYTVTIYAYNNDLSKLAPALLETKRIKWNEATCVGVNIECTKEMEDVMDKLGYRVHTDIGSNVWMLDVKTALSYTTKCPDGVYMAKLRKKDIPLVNSLWALKYEGSEKILKSYVNLNSCVGLYIKATNELVCWTVECEYSEIGVLYTMPNYRNKGYAEIVVKALAKKIAKKKNLVITYSVLGNTASENLFKKIGFKQMGEYGFIEYERK